MLSPLIKKRKSQLAHTLQLKKIKHLTQDMVASSAALVMTDEMKAEMNIDEDSNMKRRRKQEKDLELAARLRNYDESSENSLAEAESYNAPYANTEADFNEMTIQVTRPASTASTVERHLALS